MVCIHINNNIRHHSGQNLLQTHEEQCQIIVVDKSTVPHLTTVDLLIRSFTDHQTAMLQNVLICLHYWYVFWKDHERLMKELESLERHDRQRRQEAVARIPVSVPDQTL